MTRLATTADHWLVRAVMAQAGISEAEAAVAVEQVTAGILAQLRDGRRATLHGIGQLECGKWRQPVPKSCGDRGMREVSSQHATITNTRAVRERDVGSTFDAAERKRRPGR